MLHIYAGIMKFTASSNNGMITFFSNSFVAKIFVYI